MSKLLHVLFVGVSATTAQYLVEQMRQGSWSIEQSLLADADHLHSIPLSQYQAIIVDSLRTHPFITEKIMAALNAQSLDIPVLIYSSLDNKEAIVAAMKAGAKDFISSKNPQRIVSSLTRELDCVSKRAELREQAQLDNLLQEIESWMVRGEDLIQLTEKICVALATTLKVRVAWIGGKQADGSVSVVAGSEQSEVLRQLQVRWDDSPFGCGTVGVAIRTKQPVMFLCSDKRLIPWRSLAAEYGVQSVLALPLLVRDEIIGVLALYSLQSDGFSENLVKRYTQFSNRLAVILLMAQEQEQLRLLAAAMNHATQAMFITKEDGTIIWFNQALCVLSGYTSSEISDSTPHLFSSGGYAPDFWQMMWSEILQGKVWSAEVLNRRKDGGFYHVWQCITPLHNLEGKVHQFLCVQQDVSEKKELERKVEYLAYHDVLTGLPNRALFNDRMRQSVSQAKRDKTQFAVCFIDLDGFKAVNDQQGHAAGDCLLKQVADRLRVCVREVDTVARLGGDEFVVLLRDTHDENDLSNIAKKIIQRLASDFKLDSAVVKISASIGISCYPSDAQSVEKLMQCADEAMYHAKHTGKNCYVFWRSNAGYAAAIDWQI